MSDEERAALLSRVRVIEEGIVLYEEVPVQSAASLELMMSRLDELSRSWPKLVEVLDISAVRRPTPEVRAVIRRWIAELSPRLVHIDIVCGGNLVIRSVAKFLSYAMGIPASFHDTQQEALEDARRVLRGA